MRTRIKLAAAFLLALAGCGESQPSRLAAEETETRIAQGRVIGFTASNSARVWLGLPYAAPPVGDLRFRAPRPAPGWDGGREALRHGPRCLQLANGFDRDEGFSPGEVIGSEDCLTLDIYAPADPGAGKLPVMFWIHGGGNVWGRASQFDGAMLAEQQKVIVVAAQYRLGPLGWFAHPALRESAKTEDDASANFALLDLIAGLRWVRENIGAFGGDAGKVTIFGESAGGRNVAALLAAKKADGLYHRAVIQSGLFSSNSLAEAEGRDGAVPNPGPRIAAALGAKDAAALRALPAEKLLGAYGAQPGFYQLPQIISDGVVLPEQPLRAAIAEGAFNRAPLLIGTTRDEARLFMAFDPRHVVRRLWLFPTPKKPDAYEATAAFLSRIWKLTGVDQPAAAMRAAGHEAVFAYRFDWDNGGGMLWTDTSVLLGAGHALEIPFLFNDFSQLGSLGDILYQDDTAKERDVLARAMGQAWAGFARDGRPSLAGGAAWPEYGDAQRFVRLDAVSDGGLQMSQGAESIEAILADLKNHPKLNAEERCAIVAYMAGWRYAAPYQPQAARSLGCPAVALSP